MNRISSKTIAARKVQYEAAKARDAETTRRVRSALPAAPASDVHDKDLWGKWIADYAAYTRGLKIAEARLLAVQMQREMEQR